VSATHIIVLILGMTAIAFASKFTMIAILGKMDLPAWLGRSLRFVVPSVLTAVVAPAVLVRGGALAVGPSNARLVAALVAGVVAWRTRNMLWTIIAGMAAIWLMLAVGAQ